MFFREPAAVPIDSADLRTCFAGTLGTAGDGNSTCTGRFRLCHRCDFLMRCSAPGLFFCPDCGLLHRASCSDVANTCGPCLAGHMGDATFNGHGNTLCLSASLNALRVR